MELFLLDQKCVGVLVLCLPATSRADVITQKLTMHWRKIVLHSMYHFLFASIETFEMLGSENLYMLSFVFAKSISDEFSGPICGNKVVGPLFVA